MYEYLGDVERARQFYQDGEEHFEAGRYLQAASSFVSAYGEERHPNALWSAAVAYERAGRNDSAIEYYDRYASSVTSFSGTPRPSHSAADAQAAISSLRGSGQQGVVQQVISWVTGKTAPAASQQPTATPGPGVTTVQSAKGMIGQAVETVANAFGAGASKVAGQTATQTAALEHEVQNGAAPVVPMPDSRGLQLPSWFPAAVGGTVVIGLGALAIWAVRKGTTKKNSEED
jgi:hypothetical protein